jgi:hypothetical protein
MTQVSDPAKDRTDDWGEAFRRARADADRVGRRIRQGDASRSLRWGTMTGREFVDAYAHEFTIHAGDLPALPALATNSIRSWPRPRSTGTCSTFRQTPVPRAARSRWP